MSRYRPPRPAGTALITPEGEARMRAELHELWHVRRPQVTQSVSEAAAQGDRSENAEYTYGKKMLREIDSRVRFLTKRLESLKVVSEKPMPRTRSTSGHGSQLKMKTPNSRATASSVPTNWTLNKA